MAKNPSFQMYAADFLTDTQDWEAEEVGVYLRLLLSQWVNNKIPKEPKKIARIAGVSVDDLVKIWLTVGCKFVDDGSGNLINKRLEKSRSDKEAYIKKQSDNGKKSAEKRKKATKIQPPLQPPLKSGCDLVDHLVATKIQPLEEEDEEEVEKEIEKEGENEKKCSGLENLVLPFGDKIFEVAWIAWKEYKRDQHKFEYRSILTEQAALKEVGDLSDYDVGKAVKIIYQSISNGWKGLFKLKDNEQGNNQNRGGQGGKVLNAAYKERVAAKMGGDTGQG